MNKTIEVKLLNNTIKIQSDDENKISQLVEKINILMLSLKSENKGATDLKIAFLTTIVLQNQIESLLLNLAQHNSFFDAEKEQIHQSFLDILEYIATYAENLTARLKNSIQI